MVYIDRLRRGGNQKDVYGKQETSDRVRMLSTAGKNTGRLEGSDRQTADSRFW